MELRNRSASASVGDFSVTSDEMAEAIARLEGRVAAQATINVALATAMPAPNRAQVFALLQQLEPDWRDLAERAASMHGELSAVAAEEEIATFSESVGTICRVMGK